MNSAKRSVPLVHHEATKVQSNQGHKPNEQTVACCCKYCLGIYHPVSAVAQQKGKDKKDGRDGTGQNCTIATVLLPPAKACYRQKRIVSEGMAL